MLFKTQELKKLLSYVAKHKVENINLKSPNLKIIVNTKKKYNKLSINKIQKLSNFNTIINSPAIESTPKKRPSNITKEQHQYFTIISPMIGTFYRSPAPNERPFIEINDTVKTNQTVCIIEAMKLMNEIESEVNGKIVEILVKDGDIVDCGQALIKIQQDKKV